MAENSKLLDKVRSVLRWLSKVLNNLGFLDSLYAFVRESCALLK